MWNGNLGRFGTTSPHTEKVTELSPAECVVLDGLWLACVYQSNKFSCDKNLGSK